MKTLKITGKNKQNLYPADWIAGVEYDDNNDDDSDTEYEQDIDSDNYQYDDTLHDEAEYEFIDQDELDFLKETADPIANPTNTVTDDEEEANEEADEAMENEAGEEEEEPEQVEPEAADAAATVDEPEEAVQEPPVRRSAREGQPRDFIAPYISHHATMSKHFLYGAPRMMEAQHNLYMQTLSDENRIEYGTDEALIAARLMTEIQARASMVGYSFAQQYMLKKGLQVFGDNGENAAKKELDQLHRRTCFSPLAISKLTHDEKAKAQAALMFLTEKRDGTIKGRMVYNGKPTREWLSREDSASPTVSLESLMLTVIVDAIEKRDVMTCDIPNAFIQADVPILANNERIVMKITGVLVKLLVELNPELYAPFVVLENGKKVLYVQVLKALYGMLMAALQWCHKFRKDLEGIGFVFNPYDPCVANRMVNKEQHTIRFHVDDIMSSHMDSKVNDEFLQWLNEIHGKHGEVKSTRGKMHDYLGMTFEFTDDGKVKLSMIDYVNDMVDTFPQKISATASTPAKNELFLKNDENPLSKEEHETYHTFVAKGLFLCKRARPDVHTTIAALCTRVQAPTEKDWNDLVRLLEFMNGTRDDKLILSADDLHVLKWYVDGSFAMHPDFRSHTGGCFTYGRGAPVSTSRKQKLNTRSSTEAELVASDDMASMILWTKLFLEAQGIEIKQNILYQDNKSTILLQENGKKSSSQRTRAISIRYFFLTDQIAKGNLTVECCPTEDMTADYFTKPLQGKQFTRLRNLIMGYETQTKRVKFQ